MTTPRMRGTHLIAHNIGLRPRPAPLRRSRGAGVGDLLTAEAGARGGATDTESAKLLRNSRDQHLHQDHPGRGRTPRLSS